MSVPLVEKEVYGETCLQMCELQAYGWATRCWAHEADNDEERLGSARVGVLLVSLTFFKIKDTM